MPRCPECGDSLVVHTPIDPDLVHRGHIRSRWLVLACRLCGHVERTLHDDGGHDPRRPAWSGGVGSLRSSAAAAA
jgi:uncharacterized Zn finger protein